MTAPALTSVPTPDEQSDLASLVASLRARIDDLDQNLLSQVQQRRELSRQIQAARVASGGVRIELAREREIHETYAGVLGRDGTALATAVLRSCRGSL